MPPLNVSVSNDQLYKLIDDLSKLPTFTIGRAADNAIVIPNGKVSGQHARLIQCTTDIFIIEDSNSKNGSFVNGIRIARKVVDRKDIVRIADADFTIEQLLSLRKTEPIKSPVARQLTQPVPPVVSSKSEKDSLDYTRPFADLQQVHIQYPQLRRDCRNREKMIRTGSVILSSIVGISAVLTTAGSALSILQLMSGAGLSVLLPTLCSTLLSTEEKLEIIDKEYRERYRCPNPTCRDPFGMREWELLAQQKTCRRCQAIWVR